MTSHRIGFRLPGEPLVPRARLRRRHASAQRLATQPHGGAGERQRAAAQRRPALGLAPVQQPRGGRRGAQQRRVVGQPARRAQPRRLRRELARGDVLGEPDRRGRRGDAVLVDPGDLGAELARDPLAAGAVAGPDRQRAVRCRGRARSPPPRSPPRAARAPDRARARAAARPPAARRAARPARRTLRRRRAPRRDRRTVASRPPPPPARRAPRRGRAAAALASGPTSVSGRLGSPTRSLRAAASIPAASASACGRTAITRPSPAWRRPPPANAAHSAPVTARSSGAPLEHQHRALRRRRVERDDVRAAPARSSSATSWNSSSGRPALTNAFCIRAAARGAAGTSSTALPASSAAATSSSGPAHGRAVAHVDPDDAERRLDERRAPSRTQRRHRPEPPVGERGRTVAREPVQPADGRQQLGEHRLAARLPGLGGEQVGERVELVEHRHRRAAQVARPVDGGDERPEGLGGGGAVARGHAPDGMLSGCVATSRPISDANSQQSRRAADRPLSTLPFAGALEALDGRRLAPQRGLDARRQRRERVDRDVAARGAPRSRPRARSRTRWRA